MTERIRAAPNIAVPFELARPTRYLTRVGRRSIALGMGQCQTEWSRIYSLAGCHRFDYRAEFDKPAGQETVPMCLACPTGSHRTLAGSSWTESHRRLGQPFDWTRRRRLPTGHCPDRVQMRSRCWSARAIRSLPAQRQTWSHPAKGCGRFRLVSIQQHFDKLDPLPSARDPTQPPDLLMPERETQFRHLKNRNAQYIKLPDRCPGSLRVNWLRSRLRRRIRINHDPIF